MSITNRYSDNVNCNLNITLLTKLSYFLLTIILKNYRKKSKLVDSYTISQQARFSAVMAQWCHKNLV